jgi:hypothetical protein
VTLSMIPDLTRAAGVPRLVGVSHPMGQPFGAPRDSERQRAVLRAMMDLVATATAPGSEVELPFEWHQTPAQARNASRDVPPSPMAELLMKKPWLLPQFYTGRIPQPQQEAGVTSAGTPEAS